MNSSELRGLQALRGLAALSVMLFHFRWNLNDVYPGVGDRLFGWGATGVDLFFLISGFVITLTMQRIPTGMSGTLHFLQRRILRIFPAYYIILLLTFLLSGAMSIFHYPDKLANLISAMLFQPLYSDHAPFYVDDGGMYGIRWTLNYELYFYLIIGLSIFTPGRWVAITLYFLLTLFLLPVMSGYGFTLSPQGYPFASPWLGLITNPMIFLFLEGMILGLLYPLLKKMPAKLMAAAFIGSVILAIVMFKNNQLTGHGVTSSGLIYALMLLCIIGAEKAIGKYVPRSLVWLGNISFSLYLIHTLMNTGIGKRFESIGIESGVTRFALSVVLSLALAWLSWRYVEQPFYAKRKVTGKWVSAAEN
ncbi:acyltransferase [Atlantibacter sp.]|uniref:acyltransferase family protein n=1 Tax=Atlantibacter sp. TaxID=1903473 RepID=UPI0028ABBD70|nr:acyltransferase [Atlantibacter sp.]